MMRGTGRPSHFQGLTQLEHQECTSAGNFFGALGVIGNIELMTRGPVQ